MKTTKLLSAFLFAMFLVTFSCQKDDGNSGVGQQENIPDTFSEYFGNDISRDFLGNVVDSNKNPIEGVTITIGNETATTDSNGVFFIRDADVKERFGYIKAEKAGYINGSRSVVPSNGTNKITIMLLEATVVGSVNSGSTATVVLNNGSSVSFDGNFINEDGTAYSGSVDVIMHHLDPSDEDMPMQMPGMLYAQNEDGAERMLQTLGMLSVELRGSGGEELNLAEGSTSEIKIPVDPSLISIAPTTIPLWHFDEANGYWKEEGVATLQGNMYVGTVAHFSFWNCDIPAEAIMLCVEVLDEGGNELDLMKVNISSEIFGTINGYTNEKGEVCGLVPSNESLNINIYIQNNCNNTPIYTETIGPFITDDNITVIIPNNSEIIQETIVGTFNTCNGNAVTNGYVRLAYDNQNYIDTVTDGEFEINLLRCANINTFSIKGYDFDNLQLTPEINYTFVSQTTNIGTINACNSTVEFIQYSINGIDSYLALDDISCVFFINWDGRHILSIRDNSNGDACLNISGTLNQESYIGSYSLNLPELDNYDPHFSMWGECIGFYWTSTINDYSTLTFNLTSFGEVSEYVDINFSGTIIRTDDNIDTVTGVVHVLRDY